MSAQAFKYNPPLKYHGSKHYLAAKFWDVAKPILPGIVHVVEECCGSCAFTLEGLARDYKLSFAVNDLNQDLTNFWRMLQGETNFKHFARMTAFMPFSETEWRDADKLADLPHVDPVRKAVAFFVRCRQSLAGRMDSFAPVSRNRTRRGMNEQVSAWLSCVDDLFPVHQLLQKVLILGPREAWKVLEQQDGEKTLHYIDPPYASRTRTAPEVYHHEMTLKQHARLLYTASQAKGKVMISGYRDRMYDYLLRSWNRHDFDLPNNAAGGKKKVRMTECLWVNW